ncbi:hypothetical protein AMTR_s00164p00038360 [Amborella trichopoda]|uniref:SWIM-type domain-containing protein n=1 Tax=Amborella trichopoda TaxID=13333 RepID=W1PT69_AMBTC|nr:hypothetical protein AMTR_s00164p00038360 [Amborella trichopoda]
MDMSLEWSGVLTPKAQKVIDLRRDKSRFLHTVTWAHDDMYEINVDNKYALNLATHTCSCRVWQYKYTRAYSLPFNPMPDELELPEIVYTTVMPPAARRTAGRPMKRRRQTEYKDIRPLKCSRCGVVGHNRKTCKSSI